MSIVTFKDFTIDNITDRVHNVREFHGTFADNYTNICEILIEISTTIDGKEVELDMTIEPQEIGEYGCYGDDRDKGFGISTEIFKDLISHAIEGVDTLTLNDFIHHYFEKFGHTHSVELRYGKRAYLGHTSLYLTTEESKTKNAVSLVDILGDKVQLIDLTTEVISFTLDDVTVEQVEELVEGVKLSKSNHRAYELSLDHLQYAKEVAEKRSSFVYYKSALELLLEVKSKHPWGILPLELVCKNNIVRGELKSLLPSSIKKMEGDNLVYSLEELLRRVK
jgi:hypothetical protein